MNKIESGVDSLHRGMQHAKIHNIASDDFGSFGNLTRKAFGLTNHTAKSGIPLFKLGKQAAADVTRCSGEQYDRMGVAGTHGMIILRE
jgi:hypothetical protein